MICLVFCFVCKKYASYHSVDWNDKCSQLLMNCIKKINYLTYKNEVSLQLWKLNGRGNFYDKSHFGSIQNIQNFKADVFEIFLQ